MSNRTYSFGPCSHKIHFDPVTCSLYEWWCPKCNKSIKLTSQEKKLVLVAYKYGREIMKTEIINDVKKSLRL